MPKFSYKARDKEGKEIVGYKDAADQYELARMLRQDGYILTTADDMAGTHKTSLNQFKISFSFLDRFRRIKLSDKIIFTKNLGVMVGAGLTLTRALDALSRETHTVRFKTAIEDVVDNIRKGKTFSESLAAHPDVFSTLYVSMVEAGEKSGKLQDSLAVVATQMQADYDLRRKIRGALMYPMIIFIAMILIGVLMMIYVVPTLTAVFTELNVELPLSTRIIIGISNAFLHYGVFMLIGFAAIAGGVYYFFRRTPTGKFTLDFFFVKAPLLSPLAKKFNAARTARTLSSLLSAGVQILEALDITSHVVQNHYYAKVLQGAKASVQRGETMSKIFLESGDLYPSLMGEMLAVGEETGGSSKMLTEVALFYEQQIADTTRDLSTIIEPVLMIFIGAVVGFFAVSMITPMYSLSSSI